MQGMPVGATPHGPSDGIRTHGLLVPNEARYQLRYTRMFRAGKAPARKLSPIYYTIFRAKVKSPPQR